MTGAAQALRAEVEDFLFHDAELLDAWKLDEWLELTTDDMAYYVPPNEKPDADHRHVLFTVADDKIRLKERVIRLKDQGCHVEYPPSRTRRIVSNVRVRELDGQILVRANFIVHRFRRNHDIRVFVGEYRHILVRQNGTLKFKERRAILDAEELGAMGSVSFIL